MEEMTTSEHNEDVVKKIFEAVERTTLLELKEERTYLLPERADRYSRVLRAWYSRYLEEFAVLEPEVDELWLKMRPDCKTDGYCNRVVGTSDQGKRLRLLKARLKYIPKLLKGLEDYMRGLETDWWNSKKA